MKRKDLFFIFLLIITYFIVILITTHSGKYILGSQTDFEIQHYLIPDYFRTLFYSTHDLFPDFALNLGAGENIYYFSYYGLLNPIIMLSYLLPMIDMLKFITISMSSIILVSTILFYYYLRKNSVSSLISFLSSFMFLCCAPLIFHSHRHIMFVNYMPFLIMGFYGIDRFIIKKKSLLLIISVLLMILTSYYFSVSGIIVLFILGIFKYMSYKKVNFKSIFKFSLKLISRIIISVFCSMILLLPTLYTLLNGRSSSSSKINISSLFKPDNYMLGGSYSIGLSIICLIGTVYLVFKGKKENKILSVLIMLISVFPVFNFILNGTLYINAKSLIPFIPLILFNLSYFFTDIFKNKILKIALTLISIILSLHLCINTNVKDKLIESDKINNNFNNNYNKYISDTIKNDNYRVNTSLIDKMYINKVGVENEYKTTMYSSTFNKNYMDVYNSLFNNPLPYRNKFMITSSNNIIFQMFMGEKYIFTKDNYNKIYKKINNYDKVNVYKNDYVLPIGYATDRVINEKEFDKLSYKDINVLGNVVTEGKTNTDIINPSSVNYNIKSFENLEYKKTDYGYEINSLKDGKLKVELEDDLYNKLVFINFDILNNSSCKSGDLSIKINDVINKLTCKTWKYYNENSNFGYVIVPSSNSLDITFDKGNYKIGNIRVKTLDFNTIKDVNKKVDPLIIENMKGDKITGNIDVKSDSYFTISIPYDKGFEILVDEKPVNYYKVNKSFIGFNISKGKHKIEISYKAPLKNIGIIISVIGFVLCTLVYIYERRCNDENDIDNSAVL